MENNSSSSDETLQSNSLVRREIMASMAIGSQLGINFLPCDDLILGKMIELESQEYSLMLEREAGG